MGTIMRVNQGVMQLFKNGFIVSLLLSMLVPSHHVMAGKYFDKEDEKGLEHLSKAIMAWYDVNQMGMPKSDKEFNRVCAKLDKVFEECSKVPDKTLNKIDAVFSRQFRDNLQQGAYLFAHGLRSYKAALDKGKDPSEKSRSEMNSGQQKMVRFHKYYNANIERIARELKKRGVDIFG